MIASVVFPFLLLLGPKDVVIKDTFVGKGTVAAAKGDVITVLYKAKLASGKVVDSSEKKPPFAFKIGAKEVVPGFDEGVVGAKVGGKRSITVPAAKAYGAEGFGEVPPNSNMVFDIEVLRIDKKGSKPKTVITEVAPGTGAVVKDGDTLEVTYRLTFLNGFEMDKGTFSVQLGGGQVVKGFEEGLQGMKHGGKRKIVVPYALGYGEKGRDPLPAYSTLLFDIEIK